jgi:heme O synthase-like polyprenyltransferase
LSKINGFCISILSITIGLLVLSFFSLVYVEKGTAQFVVLIISIMINLCLLVTSIIMIYFKKKKENKA